MFALTIFSTTFSLMGVLSFIFVSQYKKFASLGVYPTLTFFPPKTNIIYITYQTMYLETNLIYLHEKHVPSLQ